MNYQCRGHSEHVKTIWLHPGPRCGAYSTPPDFLAGCEGAGCPSPRNLLLLSAMRASDVGHSGQVSFASVEKILATVLTAHSERLVDISYNLKFHKADLHDEQKGFTVQQIISQYGDVSSPLVSGLSVSWSASLITTC